MKKTSLPRVEPGKHAITFGKSPWERQSTPKLYEIVEPPQKHINQIDALLKSSKAMTTKCDASIQSQIEPMDLRQDKRRIWEMVHAAESQMLGELGREEHRSHNAIYKHGELCDAEASLLDIAGDYQNVAETGLEQRIRFYTAYHCLFYPRSSQVQVRLSRSKCKRQYCLHTTICYLFATLPPRHKLLSKTPTTKRL